MKSFKSSIFISNNDIAPEEYPMNSKIYQIFSLLVIITSIGFCQAMEIGEQEQDQCGTKRKRDAQESEVQDEVQESMVNNEELIAFPSELLDLVNKELAQGQKGDKKRKLEDQSFTTLPIALLDDIIRNYLLPSSCAAPGEVLTALEDAITFIRSSKQFAELQNLPFQHVVKHIAQLSAIKNFKGENLLTIAVQQQRWVIAEMLIAAGFAISELDQHHYELLFGWAISNGHSRLAQKLIDFPKQQAFNNKKQFVTDLTNAGMLTHLHDAESGLLMYRLAAHKDLALSLTKALSFDEVMRVGCMVSLKDKKTNESILHRAIANRSEHCVQLLLSEGALVDVVDKAGNLPIHLAIQQGSLSMVKLLVKFGANVNSPTSHDKQTPLLLATLQGNLDIVQFLLANKAVVDAKSYGGLTPLAAATLVSNGSLAYYRIIRLLTEHGADIKAIDTLNKAQVLVFASLNNYYRMACKLLELGADSNTKGKSGKTILMLLAGSGSSELVNLLLAYKAEVNAHTTDGETALMFAVSKDHLKTARILIEHGAVVNAQDKNKKRLPLITAILKGNVPLVKLLIASGANVNARAKWGIPALNCATISGNLEITKLLLEQGADVNAQDEGGMTALHEAIYKKFIGIAEVLIANGANVDQAHEKKRTPLMEAVLINDVHAVALLIAKGADIHLVESENKTALDLATAKGFKEIMVLLISANKRGKK